MKGSIGTACSITKPYKVKQKYKLKRGSKFCVICRGWVETGQWYSFTRQGNYRHFGSCKNQ